MDQLSIPEQQDLIKDVENTIQLTHDGMSPNDALTKIASERKLAPEMIRRAAEAFNKSKSVHVLKTAGEEERAKPFDIVDPSVVIQNIFQPRQKVASTFELPEGEFGAIDFNFSDTVLEKTATEESNAMESVYSREPTDDELKTIDRLAKQAKIEHEQFCKGMRDQIHGKIQEQKLAFDRSLDTVVGITQRMSDRQFEKMARRIVTGYPTTGPGLVALISHKSRKEVPGNLEKMANHIVFRAKEPYLSIANIYEAAEKMAAAEVELKMFEEKTAAGEPFLGSIAANTIANMLAGMGMSPEEMQSIMGSKKKSKRVEEDLDPAFYNRMKSHDAKRTFMMLALFDPDLKQYDQKALLQAYNDSVQNVPEAFDKPSVLKNLMVRNLQSSGIKDPFEMKQEMEISKQLRERDAAQERKVLEEKLRLEAEKDKDKPAARTATPISATSITGSLQETISNAGKLISETEKERQKKLPKPKAPLTVQEMTDRDMKALEKRIASSGWGDADVRTALKAFHENAGDLSNLAQERQTLLDLGYVT